MAEQDHSFGEWKEHYEKAGKSKTVLITWLKARPQDCPALVSEILDHLSASEQASDNSPSPSRNLEHESIYQHYLDGPFQSYDPFDMMTGFLTNTTAGTWSTMPHQSKLLELSKMFPNHTVQQLDEIIALQKRLRGNT